MYSNRDAIGTFINAYWSSTEADATNAYSFLFPLGTQPSPIRTSQAMFIGVRAFKYFSSTAQGSNFCESGCIVKFP
jgi:hypothetical protein